MKQKKQYFSTFLCMFLIGVLFLFTFRNEAVGQQQVVQKEAGQQEWMHHENRVDGIGQPAPAILSETGREENRTVRNGETLLRLQILSELSVLLTPWILSLWELLRRAFCGQLQTYFWPPARYLREWAIRQEQDGKKRIPAF